MSDAPKLHSHPMSAASRRVLAFAGVNGIELEAIFVDLQHGAHKKPEYLLMNPTGRVPTLVDGATTIFESLAIIGYLAEEHAPQTLGEDARDRAHVSQWSSWGLIHLGRALSALNAETGLKRMFGGTPDPAAVEVATEAVREEFSILSDQLAGREFIIGDGAPTTADFIIAASIETATWLAGIEIEDANIESWFNRMIALEGWPRDPRK